MNKKLFDIFVIIVIGLFLTTLSWLNLLEESAKFMLFPILAFYYIGKYAQRKFSK